LSFCAAGPPSSFVKSILSCPNAPSFRAGDGDLRLQQRRFGNENFLRAMFTTPASPAQTGAPLKEEASPVCTGNAVVNVSVATSVSAERRRGEFLRKLLHISPGLLAFFLPFLPHDKPLPPQALFELTLITTVLTAIYIAARRIVARPGESDFYLTTLSYPAAVLGTLFAFPGAPELGAIVVVVIAFGDGSAYLGGKQIGGPRLPWNATKTWAGTLSFLAVAGPLASLAYYGEAGAGTPWLAAILCGCGAAFLAAIAESLPTQLSDNLRVGVTAAVAAAAIHFSVLPMLTA
jgi:dolichol kinase